MEIPTDADPCAHIRSVNRRLQIEAEAFRRIKIVGDSDKRLGNLGMDTPIAHFDGIIAQLAARNPRIDAVVA